MPPTLQVWAVPPEPLVVSKTQPRKTHSLTAAESTKCDTFMLNRASSGTSHFELIMTSLKHLVTYIINTDTV